MPNYVSVSGNTVGEEEGSSWRKKLKWSSHFRYCTSDAKWIFDWKPDKARLFDVNWYRQWPVAGSVGCLSASTKAYQMTLKISSTTITLEGRRRTFHVWRACECTSWKQRFGASQYNYLHCALKGNFKGQEWFWWLVSRFVALLQEALHTHTHTHIFIDR